MNPLWLPHLARYPRAHLTSQLSKDPAPLTVTLHPIDSQVKLKMKRKRGTASLQTLKLKTNLFEESQSFSFETSDLCTEISHCSLKM